MKLSIVIPAYNEEDAIEEIVKKCLEARGPICQETGLSNVEVIIVDDGSADKTRQLAERLTEARLIVHPKNRGYGAALMTGFKAASGDYLSFLDADGTCDPMDFIALYRCLGDAGDMAVGNRLHAGSQMPKIREIGNRFYALLISKLTGIPVADTASGMRLFKRELLPKLSPLPTGLHFTPAMTARAACMGARITETPIRYSDRKGQSKLNVFVDGIRFLQVILGIIFGYYPFKIFGPLGIAFGLAALAYGIGPVSFYLANRHINEDMIYRLLTISTLTVSGLIALAFGLLAQMISDISTGKPLGWLDRVWVRTASLSAGIGLGLGGILLNSKTILEYVSSGRISIHWVYVLTGGLAVISGTVLASFGITLGIVAHLPHALQPPDKP